MNICTVSLSVFSLLSLLSSIAFATDTLCRIDERNHAAMEYVGTRPTGGRVQLGLLQLEGLQPYHHVLEVGCGALLAGIPIMSFLQNAHYACIDPNSWLRAQTLSIAENDAVVETSKPMFIEGSDFDARSAGVLFDFAFAHSIMSHAASWQLPLFLENVARVMKDDGKVIFSIRLTEPSVYGNEGAAEETNASEWQYPGVSFFDEKTVVREASKWFRKVERKRDFTRIITADDPGAFHDWFVLTK